MHFLVSQLWNNFGISSFSLKLLTLVLFFSVSCSCSSATVNLNLSKTLEQAKVFYTTDLMVFNAEVNHSVCSSSAQLKSYWHITQASLKGRTFTAFMPAPLGTSQPLWSMTPQNLDSYYYVSYILRILPDNKVIGYDYGYVLVLQQPPVANISGVSLAAPGDGNITLNASSSNNPNGDSVNPLIFTWFCRRSYEAFPAIDPLPVVDIPNGKASAFGGCYGYGPGRLSSVDEVLVVNVDWMEAGQTYVFELTVSNGEKSSKATHWLTLKQSTFFIR